MAKKNAYLLAGPAIPGAEELHQALAERAAALTAAGLALPDVTPADLFRAGVEIRRTHKAEGLRRRDVEGAWARVCRRAEKAKSDVVIAHDQFAAASEEQIALLLDCMAGFRVHVVLTPAEPDEAIAEAWRRHTKKGRVHVSSSRDMDQVVTELVTLALTEQEERLQKRMRKLQKKRRKVRKRLEDLDAA